MTEQQPPTVCQHGSLQRACLVCEVTAERDTALQRAEQAEAALAQAKAERDEARALVGEWQTAVMAYLPLGWCFDPTAPGLMVSNVAHAAAQPPALPPLPDDWEPVGAHEHRWKFNGNRVYVSPEGSAHIAEGWYRPADLITVVMAPENPA